MRRIFLFYLIFSLLLLSCHRNPNTELEELPRIRFAYSWEYGFRDLAEKFSEKMKEEFILDQEFALGLDHKQEILIDMATNDLPDVFTFWSYETNLGDPARNGLILDVDHYFFASTKIKREDFLSDSLDSTEIDGKNYALPHERFFGFMALNDDLRKRLLLPEPRTWKDLQTIANALHGSGVVPFAMGSFRGDPGHLFFSALTYQVPHGYEDTRLLGETRRFINDGTIAAADAVQRLIEWKAIPEDTLTVAVSWDNQTRLFNDEKALMIYSFNWALPLFKPNLMDKIKIIPVPLLYPGVRDPETFTVGGNAQSICINRNSWDDPQKRKAIVKVVDWLLSDPIFRHRYKAAGIFPARKGSLPETDNILYRKVVDFVSRQEVLGIHEFFFDSLYDFDVYKEANDLLWGGACDTTEFLQMVQSEVEK